MLLNKACFKTKIGDIFYLWLDEKGSRKVVALSTSKNWVDDYVAMLKEDPGLPGEVTVIENKLPTLEKDISEYLDGSPKGFSNEPLFLSGTEFEKRAWKEASVVPFGCTCSYGDLAEMCGKPRAGRAVGNAMGKNPVMFIVPCHRIIKADGSPGGFGSGPELKKKLLANEGIIF